MHASNTSNTAAAAEISDHPDAASVSNNSVAGFMAVFMAACTSGFSGIYFEKILKESKTSLWMRNIQMGVSSTILATIAVYVSDGEAVHTNGFFFGYTNIVIAVILLQALGGLVVAVVVKYADNILKGFAASFSIITSCIISYIFLDFEPSIAFVVGATLVLISSYIYEKGLPRSLIFLHKKAPWLFNKVSKNNDDHSADDVINDIGSSMKHVPAIHGDSNGSPRVSNKKNDDVATSV